MSRIIMSEEEYERLQREIRELRDKLRANNQQDQHPGDKKFQGWPSSISLDGERAIAKTNQEAIDRSNKRRQRDLAPLHSTFDREEAFQEVLEAIQSLKDCLCSKQEESIQAPPLHSKGEEDPFA